MSWNFWQMLSNIVSMKVFNTSILQRIQDRCLCEALLRGKDNWINKSFIRNLTLEQTYIRIWQPLCKNKINITKNNNKIRYFAWITHLMSGRMFEIKVLRSVFPRHHYISPLSVASLSLATEPRTHSHQGLKFPLTQNCFLYQILFHFL